MFTNDLSDNGKSFEFGYDSNNDAYGYYKNGAFTAFGGGGGLSTKCIVKSLLIYSEIASQDSQIAIFIKEDGSYVMGPDLATVFNGSDLFSAGNRTADSSYAYQPITILKDGYYTYRYSNGGSVESCAPAFMTAGSSIRFITKFHYAQYFGVIVLAYLGVELPN